MGIRQIAWPFCPAVWLLAWTATNRDPQEKTKQLLVIQKLLVRNSARPKLGEYIFEFFLFPRPSQCPVSWGKESSFRIS